MGAGAMKKETLFMIVGTLTLGIGITLMIIFISVSNSTNDPVLNTKGDSIASGPESPRSVHYKKLCNLTGVEYVSIDLSAMSFRSSRAEEKWRVYISFKVKGTDFNVSSREKNTLEQAVGDVIKKYNIIIGQCQ
jgi:hypothetical protein